MPANRTWLVLDVSYLCWRSYHTTGQLSHGTSPTGVTFGFFRDLHTLMEQHATRNVVCCFDGGKTERKKLYPRYNEVREAKRKESSDEEKAQYIGIRNQIEKLRTEYLPSVGLANVLHAKGYEADDLIARTVMTGGMPKGDEAVIVSADKDLWQLLRPNVVQWNPHQKKCYTAKWFKEEYGIEPPQWAHVKAIAGCDTDSVPGAKGIGEKTAAAFLSGKLKDTSIKYGQCKRWRESAQYVENMMLTKLPFATTPPIPDLKETMVSPREWTKLTESLGMLSLSGKVPGARQGFGIPRRRS